MTNQISLQARLSECLAPTIAALTFHDDVRALTRVEIAATLALHLVGLGAAAYLLQLPVWVALLALILLSIVPMLLYRARRTFALQTLAPLFFLYAFVAARFVYIRVFGGAVPGYFDYNAPDLRSSLFRLEPWAICSLIYTLAIQVRYLPLSFRAGREIPLAKPRFLDTKTVSRNDNWVAPITLILVTFVWAGALYIGHRTHGVTGTDPYAYVQMGVDLALRGTPLHRFPLFPSVAPLNVAWSPVVHQGYHIPINSSGDAASVWPIGGSFAFALAYRLAGEEGLYLVNPLASLLLLVATGWLAWELFHDSKDRTWIAALSVAILATSHTFFDWATVPMVDSQAAVFSVLAIGLAIRFARQPQLGLPILSGLALGAAYFVRHTQVLIVPTICALLWLNGAPRGLRVRALLVAGLAAFVVALPDLWYHQVAFGGWLNLESTELNLFSFAAIGETANALTAGLLAAREFGWILPFLLYGAYRLARNQRVEFTALALWVLVLVGFHLLYPALRPRDLLPEFPPLVIIAAYGVVALVSALWNGGQNWRKLVAASGLVGTLFLLLIRVWNVFPIPFGEPQRSFGYLTAPQRASFDQIATLTPPNAVIGSSLNTGPLDLYARRETFLPIMWLPQEQDTFFAAMFREGRAIYLLDDSAGITTLRRRLEERYALLQIAKLDVPLSGILPDTSSALWEIRTLGQSGK